MGETKQNNEGISYVTLPDGETQSPPLADGEYDAIILSTGLEECILAGLLAIRGKKVLQVDPNDFYGGSCASLTLTQIFERAFPNEKFDKAELEKVFGSSRDFCMDLVPKLLLASGKLVKMLVQTGVTKYMDFSGINSSYVYNSGKIYKLPVTPTEALTSGLVRMFQKPKLRSFADFVAKYRAPIDKDMVKKLTENDFISKLETYCSDFKVSPPKKEDCATLSQRTKIVGDYEGKFGFPIFPVYNKVNLSSKAPLGLQIEAVKLNGTAMSYVVRVQGMVAGSQGEKSKVIEVDDVFYTVNGVQVYGQSEKEVKAVIVQAVQSKDTIDIEFLKNFKFGEKTLSKKYSRYHKCKSLTAEQLMDEFGLDSDTKNFLGHGMALQTSDEYLQRSCEDFVQSCRVYANSIGRYGQKSPYLFPQYGLASLPEGFARLSAIYGGTVMLRTKPSRLIFDKERVWGVEADGMVAKLNHNGVVIGDAEFFPAERKIRTGKVIRSICLLAKEAKSGFSSHESAQIIIPAKHIPNKSQDVYVSILNTTQKVCSKNVILAIASTQVENENQDPVQELEVAFNVMGGKERILKRFDFVSETYKDNGVDDGSYITTSLDATSNFESAAKDIMNIYQRIFGVELDLDQKIIETQAE